MGTRRFRARSTERAPLRSTGSTAGTGWTATRLFCRLTGSTTGTGWQHLAYSAHQRQDEVSHVDLAVVPPQARPYARSLVDDSLLAMALQYR